MKGMGKVLYRLLQGSPAYSVMKEKDGYLLVAQPGHVDEFSDLVCEVADYAGVAFVAFPVCDGGNRYSQMLVMPVDETPSQSS